MTAKAACRISRAQSIMPPFFPDGLDRFTTLVVPLPRKRGWFRSAYPGRTLRHILGLARPART